MVAHRERAAGRESGVAGSSPACEAPYLRQHLSIELFRRAVELGLSATVLTDQRVQIPPQPPIWLGSQLVSCPSRFFDGSQDWVIACNARGRRFESGLWHRCQSSSVVEHVIPSSSFIRQFLAGRRSWVIGHCKLAVQIRFRVSTRVAQFVEPQCYPDRSLPAALGGRAQALLMGRRHRVICHWFDSNPGRQMPR